jgi:OmpA-OmpF porin, OOP family
MKIFKGIDQSLKMPMIFLTFAQATVLSAVQAQPSQDAGYASSAYFANVDESSAKGVIHVAANVNTEARAIQLQHSINSPYDDIKPRLTPGGDRLYFSRNFHPGNANGVNDPEDIWYSDFNKSTNTWSEPIHMSGVLNNSGPNYINNVSVSGDTIILGNQYLKKGKMRAGLSYSVRANGNWSVPTTINIVNDYNISDHANSFVSLRNGIIISAVQRSESLGGRDLFVSFWDGTKATEPINMGTVINTEGEESSPFLAADSKTMYFASKGHKGYGGYDIFVTHRLDETWTNWSTPENLGPAVNGDLDDEFFSVTHCGNYAVFSKQVNVHNNDLFRISMSELFQGNIPVNNTAPESITSGKVSFAAL